MKNKKIIFIILAVVIVIGLAVEVAINGFFSQVTGVYSFTTKYHKTPEKAIEKYYTPSQQITESLDFIQVDNYNGMFIGITDEYDAEDYILISMQTKNNKYFCSGQSCVYSGVQKSDNVNLEGNKIFMYDGRGQCSGEYECFIVYDESNLQMLDNTYKTHMVTMNSGNVIYFVYRIIEDGVTLD